MVMAQAAVCFPLPSSGARPNCSPLKPITSPHHLSLNPRLSPHLLWPQLPQQPPKWLPFISSAPFPVFLLLRPPHCWPLGYSPSVGPHCPEDKDPNPLSGQQSYILPSFWAPSTSVVLTPSPFPFVPHIQGPSSSSRMGSAPPPSTWACTDEIFDRPKGLLLPYIPCLFLPIF